MADSDLPGRHGDDLRFKFECLNSDQTAFNLTGSTIEFRAYHGNSVFALSHAQLTINAAAGTVEGRIPVATVNTLPLGAITNYELDRVIDGNRETLAAGRIVISEGYIVNA